MTDQRQLNVEEILSGEVVLITGATGFLGKVLTEKLLRSCQGVKHLYLLARDKKGKLLEQRMEEIFSDPLFGPLEKEQPKFREKVTAIPGDCSQPGLGLNVQDRNLLVREVSLVLHAAATVRFDEELRTAYNINVRGTKEMLLLSKEMKSLKGFVHISTAYANCNRLLVGEEIYDPPIDPDRLEKIMDTLDDELLDPILPSLLKDFPNTYAYTKAVAEHVVKEFGKDIPKCIFRPAVVVGTAEGPLVGWTDNLYGPTGIVVGAGCGVVRTLYGDTSCVANVVPVDFTVSALLTASARILNNPKEAVKELKIYNYVSAEQNPLKWWEFKEYIELHGDKVPPIKALWCYSLVIHKWWWTHLICTYLLHYLPAIFMDLFSKITRKENTLSLVRIYKKVDKLSGVLYYYSKKNWKFSDDNVRELWSMASDNTKKEFNFDIKSLNWSDFFQNYIRGLRVYLLKDDMSSLPQAKIRWKRFQMAHQTIKIILALLLARFIYVVFRLVLV